MFDDRDVELKGRQLVGKKIDLIVTGGIAAIESPKLVRELRRFGAEVRVFMTPAATQFITPLSLEWASKNKVITDLSGSAEHITHSDAVIVAPATLDFISKTAMGFADSAAGTLLQSAISRLPVFFAPSMHLSLSQNPIYQNHLKNLSSISNVEIFDPVESEGKAKLLSFEEITARICHRLSASQLKNISMVISLGPTRSYADDFRYLSNRSSGTLGFAIADELFRRGANVTCIAGPTQIQVPSYLPVRSVETLDQMRFEFLGTLDSTKAKVAIFCAAVLDFEVTSKSLGKTSSKSNWSIDLKPTQKLIQSVSAKNILKVGFKLESNISIETLKEIAKDSAKSNEAAIVVANRMEDIGNGKHRAFIFNATTQEFFELQSKKEIAQKLADLLEQVIT